MEIATKPGVSHYTSMAIALPVSLRLTSGEEGDAYEARCTLPAEVTGLVPQDRAAVMAAVARSLGHLASREDLEGRADSCPLESLFIPVSVNMDLSKEGAAFHVRVNGSESWGQQHPMVRVAGLMAAGSLFYSYGLEAAFELANDEGVANVSA